LTLDTILAELKAERNRLSRAIGALEDTAVAASEGVTATIKKSRKKARKMSAEARQRIGEAKKKWWAKRKKLKLT
jgi:hypothetical protein